MCALPNFTMVIKDDEGGACGTLRREVKYMPVVGEKTERHAAFKTGVYLEG